MSWGHNWYSLSTSSFILDLAHPQSEFQLVCSACLVKGSFSPEGTESLIKLFYGIIVIAVVCSQLLLSTEAPRDASTNHLFSRHVSYCPLCSSNPSSSFRAILEWEYSTTAVYLWPVPIPIHLWTWARYLPFWSVSSRACLQNGQVYFRVSWSGFWAFSFCNLLPCSGSAQAPCWTCHFYHVVGFCLLCDMMDNSNSQSLSSPWSGLTFYQGC